jgi:hypothetical protein
MLQLVRIGRGMILPVNARRVGCALAGGVNLHGLALGDRMGVPLIMPSWLKAATCPPPLKNIPGAAAGNLQIQAGGIRALVDDLHLVEALPPIL